MTFLPYSKLPPILVLCVFLYHYNFHLFLSPSFSYFSSNSLCLQAILSLSHSFLLSLSLGTTKATTSLFSLSIIFAFPIAFLLPFTFFKANSFCLSVCQSVSLLSYLLSLSLSLSMPHYLHREIVYIDIYHSTFVFQLFSFHSHAVIASYLLRFFLYLQHFYF
ncbi:unnamed protein product [Acanthosepion pharaonis]|uniref:Uncharacterized protein n=1 Tax=Acanthosepion pharaonis TaxID=158019 RepID=A0A812DK00_ACAPH|nr:unnamed protein product [Sepia pharaonis]